MVDTAMNFFSNLNLPCRSYFRVKSHTVFVIYNNSGLLLMPVLSAQPIVSCLGCWPSSGLLGACGEQASSLGARVSVSHCCFLSPTLSSICQVSVTPRIFFSPHCYCFPSVMKCYRHGACYWILHCYLLGLVLKHKICALCPLEGTSLKDGFLIMN